MSILVGGEKPVVPREHRLKDVSKDLARPKMDDICDYLRAFYHNMGVKIYEEIFRWRPWDVQDSGRISLVSPGSGVMIGIGYRPSPDGITKVQLNLNNILDAFIERVPDDAYAMVMMVDHDLYEDEEDDFCCGRAYGGSRVAVVTSFRYHPMLDGCSEIDLEHMWPASHCQSYIDDLCASDKKPARRGKTTGPLRAAVEASADTLKPKSRQDYISLWFSRTARTLSHELGHCLRFEHCVYYACVMQGTASVAEDVRQPPYLCPVCLAKLSVALSPGVAVEVQRKYIRERYEALREYCEVWKGVGIFGGWRAGVEGRLEQMEMEQQQ